MKKPPPYIHEAVDADSVAALIEAGANKQGVADALKFARIQRIPAGNSGYAR